MDYELPQLIESIWNGGETPPTWLRTGVILSLFVAVYMYGVMNGIQLGAAAQALGTVNVPPVFIDVPIAVEGSTRFIPSATMFEMVQQAKYSAMMFAAVAAAGIVGWRLHTRLP
jgi:hypothetical protein